MELNRNIRLDVGTSSIVISEEKSNENVNRVEIILINTSTGGEVITVAVDNEAVALNGIVLYQGGNYSFTIQGSIFPTQKQINAICSGAGGKLSVYERVISNV